MHDPQWELHPAARVYVAFVDVLTCRTHRCSSVCSLLCIIQSSTRAGHRAWHGYAIMPMKSSQLFQTGWSTSYAHNCEAYVAWLVWAVVLLCALWAQVAWPGASRRTYPSRDGQRSRSKTAASAVRDSVRHGAYNGYWLHRREGRRVCL
jgi:hypothetical protein